MGEVIESVMGCSMDCMPLPHPVRLDAARCICLRRWSGSESRLLLTVGVRAASVVEVAKPYVAEALLLSSAFSMDMRRGHKVRCWSGWKVLVEEGG